MLAICSNCEKPIIVDAPGWNDCKYCQRTVWIPDPMNPDAAVPPAPAPPPKSKPAGTLDTPILSRMPAPPDGPALEIPWEQSGPGQMIQRFLSTLGVVLFRSRRTFTGLADTPRTVHLMAYGTLVLTIGLFTYFQVQALSFAVLEGAVRSGGSMPTPGPWVTEMLQSMKTAKMDVRFFLLSSALSPLMAWSWSPAPTSYSTRGTSCSPARNRSPCIGSSVWSATPTHPGSSSPCPWSGSSGF
jgi:hypothetical protein